MNFRQPIERIWIFAIIQIISFLFIILPGLFTFPIPFIIPLFFLIEVFTIYTVLIKKYNQYFFFLWQFQFFLYIVIQILANPLVFFDLTEISIRPIITLLFFIGGMEALIIIYVIFREASIKSILLILSLSTTVLVFLIIIFVAQEGLPAFQENDPYNFIFGSEWKPTYHTENNDTIQISTTIETDIFTLESWDDHVYLIPNQARTIPLSIRNNINNAITISMEIFSSDWITASLSPNPIVLHPYQESSINISLKASQQGSGFLRITATSDIPSFQSSKNLSIVSSSRGVDLFPDHILLQESEGNLGRLRPSFDVTNLGSVEDEFQISIESPQQFNPSVTEGLNGSWDYSNSTGNIRLKPGETREIVLYPRLIDLDPGTYQLNMTVSSLTDSEFLDTATILHRFKIDDYITIESYQQTIYPDNVAKYPFQIEIPAESHAISLIGNQPGWTTILYDDEGNVVFEGENTYNINPDKYSTLQFSLHVIPTEQIQSDKFEVTLVLTQHENIPRFGIFPFIIGTILTSLIAISFAGVIGLGSALFLAEYCPKKIHNFLRPIFELLAGIPSVLYGLWGVYTFGPFLADHIYPIITNSLGHHLWFFAPTDLMVNSILTASIVLGVMILPIIITLSEDAIRSVPRGLKEGSYAVGATKLQTIKKITLPQSKSGIITSMILATGRAIGETMAVLMIMGDNLNIPSSLFDVGGTMTSVIANTFLYSASFPRTSHALFAIALILFIMVFCLILVINVLQQDKKTSDKQSFFNMIGRIIQNSFLKKNKRDDKNKGSQKAFKILESKKIKQFKILDSSSEYIPVKRPPNYSLFNQFARPKTKWFYYKEKITAILILISALFVSMFLIYILGDILIKGGLSIKPEYFYLPELRGGLEGGFANAIVGSLQLTVFALAFAAPLSIAAAIYIQEYTKKDNVITKIILFASDTLASTPSIVFGAFGFAFFVRYLDFGWSLFAGGLTLGIMVIPLILRASIEAIKVIPHSFKEGALALGATKWQSIRSVILPPATPTIVSGVIISMGRAMGETAAIIFTAGYASRIATSIFDMTGSMPNMIYNYFDLGFKFPELQDKVYSAGAVLIIVILLLNSVSRIITYRYGRMMKD